MELIDPWRGNPVEEVVLQVGFADEFTSAAWFKRATGFAPTALSQ